ncbi:COG1470 family protein [Marinobacter sp. OP 3.4]|uniref:COG1470 family protein n=1 Tax=Marinobacter sp. OP 3.4 TaxID=3076501 RepID=UPI002E1B9BCA
MQTEHCAPAPRAETGAYLPSPLSLLLLPPRLLFATLDSGAGVIRRTFDGSYEKYDAALCKVCNGVHREACCDIPETSCPVPCHIRWRGCVGNSFRYELQITNRTRVEREFTLTPEPFPVTGETVTVSPDKKTLGPDESATVVVSFTNPEAMAGGCYQSRIKLVGAYEEHILVSLEVRARQCCQCHIEQGEMPKKVRAHHWYHHFQCTQDCFPPAGDRP